MLHILTLSQSTVVHPVVERQGKIRIKTRFFNIMHIFSHAPMEEKDGASKDLLYEQLKLTYERRLHHDTKFALGDFIDTMKCCSINEFIMYPVTQSRDRKTRNQIDNVVIEETHASSVLHLRTFQGPTIDSDLYLGAVEIRTRLCAANMQKL